jgi:hypothetical protein
MTRTPSERRGAGRRTAAEHHGITAMRVRPGRPVEVVNVSASGVLVQTLARLLPGAIVEIQLTRRDRTAGLRARVVRSNVGQLTADRVWYQCALSFDRRLPWLQDDGPQGYPVPIPGSVGSASTAGGGT